MFCKNVLPMKYSMHESCPTTTVVLSFNVCIISDQECSNIQMTQHGRIHQGGCSILWMAPVGTRRVFPEDTLDPSEVSFKGKVKCHYAELKSKCLNHALPKSRKCESRRRVNMMSQSAYDVTVSISSLQPFCQFRASDS